MSERLHYQLRDLTVCNEDLRHCTDPEYRDFIKRLRKLREEGMWRVPSMSSAPLDYGDVDWAAHRVAVALGVDRPLYRDDEDAPVDLDDVRLLLQWLRWLTQGEMPSAPSPRDVGQTESEDA